VAILGLEGYDRPVRPTGSGNEGIHSVSGKHLTPVLEVLNVPPHHDLVALVHIGSQLEDLAAVGSKVTAYAMPENGTWKVVWADGTVVTIPPLKPVRS
jgi:hypothetical protein